MGLTAAQNRRAWPNQLRQAIASQPDLETWRHHLALRSIEMGRIAAHMPDDLGGALLEVGCGNGFGSAYFADRATAVVASDLARGGSGGALDRAHPSIEALPAARAQALHVAGCSGEDLPLTTNVLQRF